MVMVFFVKNCVVVVGYVDFGGVILGVFFVCYVQVQCLFYFGRVLVVNKSVVDYFFEYVGLVMCGINFEFGCLV